MRTTDLTATGVDERSLRSLRGWNLALTLLHLGQAVAVVVLATDFAVTVTRSLPTGPPGTPTGSPEALFDLPIGAAVAAFLALAALDHLLTATACAAPMTTTFAAGSTGSGGWSTRSARP